MNKKELEYKLIEITRKYHQLLEKKNDEKLPITEFEMVNKVLNNRINKDLTIRKMIIEMKRKDNEIKQKNEEIERLKEENKRLKEENKILRNEAIKKEYKYRKKKNKVTATKLRGTKEYREFRLKILERDNNKCVKCGSTQKLQIHHIKPANKFPELLMEESNVQTLCAKCHIDTESYLKG